MWTRDGKVAGESKHFSEDYLGADGVMDKNKKMHDPKSAKGKTIINMKCNNPAVKDKEGCGTWYNTDATDKDKKRRRTAVAKGAVSMVKKGGKAVGKAAADMATKSGFGNPFDLKSSKYSPEDKAIEMMKEAMNKVTSK